MPRTIQLPPAPEGPDRPVILARVYPGRHVAAVEWFQSDAELLATVGYFPVAQSYAEGRHSDALALLAVLLIFVFGIGLLLLLYMAAVRPMGTLAVTYELRGVRPAG